MGQTNANIHFVDERDLLTTELSDYNDLCFERNELCNRQDFVQNGKWKTIFDKYDLSDFNKRILGFLCGIKI